MLQEVVQKGMSVNLMVIVVNMVVVMVVIVLLLMMLNVVLRFIVSVMRVCLTLRDLRMGSLVPDMCELSFLGVMGRWVAKSLYSCPSVNAFI